MKAIRGGIADSIGATFEAPVVTEFKLQKKIDSLEQQLHQAHRQGWEQCQREAVDKLDYLLQNSFGSRAMLDIAHAHISSMEYKETTNGL